MDQGSSNKDDEEQTDYVFKVESMGEGRIKGHSWVFHSSKSLDVKAIHTGRKGGTWAVLWEKTRSLVLEMLNLICLFNIQIEISSRQLE